MEENAFNPHIRYVRRVDNIRLYPEMICAYDFRMFYVISGSFCVELEEKRLSLVQGDLLTIPPGTPYRLVFGQDSPEYYILNFDFESRRADAVARAPVSVSEFDRADIFSSRAFSPFDEVNHRHNAEMAEAILSEINECDADSTRLGRYRQSALMKYLLTVLASTQLSRTSPKTERLISEVKSYINKNRSTTNIDVAAHFGYHPYHLNSLFLQSEKMTMHKYIVAVRLKAAKDLLTATDKTVCEIAEECGFPDASYFCKFFSRKLGITPGKYRNLPR